MVERREVKQHSAFRYVILENSFQQDNKLFRFPLALTKLAHFIIQAYKFKNKKAKNKPMVISVDNPEKKTFLIVAVLGPDKDSATKRNIFGEKFRIAAQSINVVTQHDGFETAMVEVRKLDLKQFIEKLGDNN